VRLLGFEDLRRAFAKRRWLESAGRRREEGRFLRHCVGQHTRPPDPRPTVRMNCVVADHRQAIPSRRSLDRFALRRRWFWRQQGTRARRHSWADVGRPESRPPAMAIKQYGQMDREGRANDGGADTSIQVHRMRGGRRLSSASAGPARLATVTRRLHVLLPDGRLDEVDEVDLRRAVVHLKSTGAAARCLSSHLASGPCFPFLPPPPDASEPPSRMSTGPRQRLHPDQRHLRQILPIRFRVCLD